MRDLDAARNVLGALRAVGVRIALDNFGTGCAQGQGGIFSGVISAAEAEELFKAA